MATVKIETPIVGFSAVEQSSSEVPPKKANEYKLMPRPDLLHGTTYRISPVTAPHSYYITINDVDMPDGRRVPFEIFVNSKSAEGLDTLNGLMLVISSVFRNYCSNPDINNLPIYLFKQLRSVNSYMGPYIMPGGRRYGSVVAHFVDQIEQHFVNIGLLEKEDVDATVKHKREVAHSKGLLQNARQCVSCGEIAVVKLDGCDSCLECGISKC